MIRRLIASVVLLAWTASAGIAATATFPSNSKSINARDYRTACDGSTDDTAHIQAAIDAAYAAKIQTVYLPAGSCKITTSLFLDAPGNLRGSAAAWAVGTAYAINATVTHAGVPWKSLSDGNVGHTPSVTSTFWAQTTAPPRTYAFSMCLIGDPGMANHEGFGTQLKPTFNNGVALWVGTGNGMCVKSVQVLGPSGAYRGLQNGGGVGIGIAGGNGGASRTLIENSWVENFYTCYETGANGNSNLADSNSFRKVAWNNCHQGIFFSQTQNDINDVVEPTDSGGATIEINSNVGRPVHVWGGNLSATSAKAAALAISSVSAITATPNANAFSYSFTAALAAPDQYVNRVYNAYAFKTVSFGVVPATLTGWNSGTNTGTFAIDYDWGVSYFASSNAVTLTALQAELQAATKVYATEQVTVFLGSAITAIGTHIENPQACTQLLDDYSGFTGDSVSELDRLYFNFDPGMTQYHPASSPTDAQLALFYCAQVKPFIWLQGASSGTVQVRNSSFGQNYRSDPVLIDAGTRAKRIIFQNLNGTLFAPNTLAPNYNLDGNITGSYAHPYTMGFGAGDWDVTPFMPHLAASTNAMAAIGYGLGVPFRGWHVAPWVIPRISGGQFTMLSGTLPAIGLYPPVDGQTPYSVIDYNSGALAHLFARSAHQFYSYGQNLTASAGNGQISGLSWSHKGQSFVVNLDATSVNWMFAGLGVSLDNGGGPLPYEVTGVYPGLGYITVIGTSSDGNAAQLLSGVSTTTYTGSTIGQPGYAFTQY